MSKEVKLTEEQKKAAGKLNMSEEEYSKKLKDGKKLNKLMDKKIFRDSRRNRIESLERALSVLRLEYYNRVKDKNKKFNEFLSKLDDKGLEQFKSFAGFDELDDSGMCDAETITLKENIAKLESMLKKEKTMNSVIEGVLIAFCIEALIAMSSFPVVKTITKLSENDISIALEVAKVKKEISDKETVLATKEEVQELITKVEEAEEVLQNNLNIGNTLSNDVRETRELKERVDRIAEVLKEKGYNVELEAYKGKVDIEYKNNKKVEHEFSDSEVEYFDYATGEKTEVQRSEKLKEIKIGDYVINVEDSKSIEELAKNEFATVDETGYNNKITFYADYKGAESDAKGVACTDFVMLECDKNYNLVSIRMIEPKNSKLLLDGEEAQTETKYIKLNKWLAEGSDGKRYTNTSQEKVISTWSNAEELVYLVQTQEHDVYKEYVINIAK